MHQPDRPAGGSKPRALKEQPASLDLFGWCTWDAFYFAVSAKGIQQGLQSLKDSGVPPRWEGTLLLVA